MRITAIEPQQRNPTRRNLYIDGAFALGISAETLLRYGIRKGDEIEQPLLEEIARTEELVNAKAVALHYLGVRPRTERELRDKLRDKEFGDVEIAKTIAGLASAGLVNDREFAGMYVRDQLQKKPAGRLLLTKKLLLLGVPRPIIDEVLAEYLQGPRFEESALRLAQAYTKKERSLRKGDDDRTLRKKTAAMLARRGFAWDTIQGVLKSLFSSTPEGPDDLTE